MTMKTFRLKGDWMTRGKIDNLNRRREMKVTVDFCTLYSCDIFGQACTKDRLILDDGEIILSDSTSFMPDEGELARIGFGPIKAGEI